MAVLAVPGAANALDHSVYACVNNSSQEVRIIAVGTQPAGWPSQCRHSHWQKAETPLVWAVVGPVGPAGANGATGPQGPSGAAGAMGPQGLPGQDGRDGRDGRDGTVAAAPPPTTEIELSILDLSGTPSRVLAWSFGVSNSSTISGGGGGSGAGKANIQDISLTKVLDHISVPLMAKAVTGVHLHDAELRFYDVSTGSRVLLGTNKYETVLVSSVSTGGTTVGPITENVTLNFGKITSQIILDGTTYTSCFDILLNRACQ
jgi:type VI protein secretion system component Hcp